jgi:hypothetical protein
MRPAFPGSEEGGVSIEVEDVHGVRGELEITTSGEASYPKWSSVARILSPEGAISIREIKIFENDLSEQVPAAGRDQVHGLSNALTTLNQGKDKLSLIQDHKLRNAIQSSIDLLTSSLTKQYIEDLLADFIVYSPETTALRTFEREGQILPLGVRGEGLLKLLRVMATEDETAWNSLQQNLELLDWLSGIDIDQSRALLEQSLRIRDRFVAATLPPFDQRSANEGFLYLLFFFALILSKSTPRCFAIENIDTSLNPKACSELMHRLSSLIIEREKQVLLTTHNPSILDGLNLHDEEQRLFVVSRNKHGHTVARRVTPPEPIGDELPIRLSEAFVRGLLGGIPQNF